MILIHTASTGILITHHHNSCTGDACGDASSSHHHHLSHLPAMVGKYHKMDTIFNRKNFI